MHRVDIDGVPVFWRQGPEPLTATLMFSVGRRDETFIGGGVTHLVEHLVMRAFGRTHLDCNATVDLSRTSFTATGRPDAVKGFLESVCRILRDLPVDAIDIERSVLRREGGAAAHPLECAAMTARFGARDLGLAGLIEPALDKVSGDQVRAWVERFFVTENAALALTGPPPPDLDLQLVGGTRNNRAAPVRRPLSLPAWTNGPEGAAVAFLATRTEALMAGLRIGLERMLDELRHGRGDAYHLDFTTTGVDATTDLIHVTFLADPEDRKAGSVANAIMDILEKLAHDGPTEEELRHDHDGMAEAFSDPRSAESEALSCAAAHLVSRPHIPEEQVLEEHRGLAPSTVAAAVAEMLASAIAVVPEDLEFARPRFREVPPSCGAPLRGREFKRRRFGSWAPPGSRLHLATDGVSVTLDDGDHFTTLWSNVNGVGVGSDGVYLVQSEDGVGIPLRAADWQGGREVIKVLEEQVPAELFFTSDSDDQDAPVER
jgi:predicted Zn-dependent peptidase